MDSKSPNSDSAKRAAIVQQLGPDVFDVQAAQSFEDALHVLAMRTRLAIGAHQCAISYIPRGEFRAAIHTHSFSEKYAKYNAYDVMPTGQGIWSLIVREKKAVRMTSEELFAHPLWSNFSGLKDARGLEHPPMRGWLATPVLNAMGEVLGVLQLSDKCDDADFTPADLDLLIHLAQMVLPTFELHFANQELARHAEELRRNRDELEQRVQERTAELERAHEAVADSERVLRMILDNIPQGVFWKDRQSRYLGCNRVVSRAFGLASPEQVRGQDDRHLPGLSHAQAEFFLARDREVMEANSPMLGIIEQATLADGATIWLETNKVPMLDATGTVVGILGTWQDISERKRADAKLQESTEQLRIFIEHSPVALAMFDREMRYLHASLRWKKDLKLGDRDLTGLSHYDVFPEVPQRWVEVHRRGLAGEVVRAEEDRFDRADGSVQWLRWEVRPWHDAAGAVGGILIFFEEITERKRAQEALRASEERYRDLLENANDLVQSVNADGRFVYVNRAWRQILGYAEDEVGKLTIWDIIHPDSRHYFELLFQEFVSGVVRSRERIEVCFRTKDNRKIALEGNVSVKWVDGKFVNTRAIFHDITERKRAEEALRESEARFRAIVRATPECVKLVAPDGTLLEMNDAGLRMVEADASVLGQCVYNVIAPEFRDAFRAFNERICRGEQGTFQFDIIGLCGTRRHMETTAVPLPTPDGKYAQLAVTRDVTERKRAEDERRKLEAQIQHAQKLESMGVLAGGIAHDFNNILTSILGYSDLALHELPAHSAARPLIDEAINGARKAADLTNQMLAYSGKGKFVVRALSLNAIVEDMAHLLQVSISKKCVLKYSFQPNLPAIEADATQLRQVIMNLIINASDAIGERSGVIAVNTGAMHCDHDYLSKTYLDDNLAEGLYVFLEVADTGCGMSEETRGRIFDPFFTTKFTGRGLGLAAVLGIVRGHRGAIRVYSELGKGTTIKVVFPASEQAAMTEPTASGTKPEWRGSGTVLIVDDEESVRGLARHMLQKMGFTVLTAADGREGVEAFRSDPEKIRLVLLDMTMPHLDGAETFREMRRIRSDVKAILSSGYNEQSATSHFAGKGLAGFIQKPYRFDELLAVVRKVFDDESDAHK